MYQLQIQLERIHLYFWKRNQKYIFADHLGQSFFSYKQLNVRLSLSVDIHKVYELWEISRYKKKTQFFVVCIISILLFL